MNTLKYNEIHNSNQNPGLIINLVSQNYSCQTPRPVLLPFQSMIPVK